MCTSPETSLMQSQPSESLTKENLRPREDGGGREALGPYMGSYSEMSPPGPHDLFKCHILSVTRGGQQCPGCLVSLPSFKDLSRDRA